MCEDLFTDTSSASRTKECDQFMKTLILNSASSLFHVSGWPLCPLSMTNTWGCLSSWRQICSYLRTSLMSTQPMSSHWVGHFNSSVVSKALVEFRAHTILVVGEPVVHIELHPTIEIIVSEVTASERDDSEETLRRSRNPLIHPFVDIFLRVQRHEFLHRPLITKSPHHCVTYDILQLWQTVRACFIDTLLLEMQNDPPSSLLPKANISIVELYH